MRADKAGCSPLDPPLDRRLEFSILVSEAPKAEAGHREDDGSPLHHLSVRFFLVILRVFVLPSFPRGVGWSRRRRSKLVTPVGILFGRRLMSKTAHVNACKHGGTPHGCNAEVPGSLTCQH